MKKTFALLLMLVLALGVSAQAATLPAEYTEVEYIQSEGRGYIDTEFVPADATTSIAYEIDFQYDITNFSDSSKVMLGVGADDKRCGNIVATTNSASFNSKTAICFGDQAPGAAASKYDNTLDRVTLDVSMDLTENTYTVKKDGVVVGTEKTAIVGDVKSAYSLYLFASHNASAPAFYAPGKVYGLKMYQDGDLVRDFVPCYRVADDVTGLYDTVNSKFYASGKEDTIFYPGQERELVEGDTAIVVNAKTGEVYYGLNTKLEHGMASTTKVMTCILTIENMALTDRTLVANEFDCDTSGSMMHLQVGEQLLIYDALRGLMLPSGNDAAKLLARTVGSKVGDGYDTFIEMMNQKAVEIGMMNTHYNSPIGGEYTTVEDYAKLGAYCMQNPIFREVVATVDYTIKADPAHGVKQHILRNTNYLLPGTFTGTLPTGESFGDVYEYEGITGIKTGTTSSAGACLLATATREINGENVDLVSVILGTNGNESVRNRFTETIKMFDLGFEKAETVGYDVTVNGNVLTAKNPETGYTMTATITAPDVALTGEKVEPAIVETTYEGGNMTWNTYWDVTYTNNDKVGTATASITFGGKTASCTFEIVEPTVTQTEAVRGVDTLVIPAGQTYDLNGNALQVRNGLVVNEGGKIINGTLCIINRDNAVVSLGSNGGWVPIWYLADGNRDYYDLYPAEIKAGKTVVSTETGTTYSFGYKLTEKNSTLNPYNDAVNAGDKIKFGVRLNLGETKATYNFSADSVSKMAGINASASSDAFFKVNLSLAGANNPLTKVRVAPVIKVDALGFEYVGETTGETDGEYVARVGNNTWYYTIEDAIAAAEAASAKTGTPTDVKIIHDIDFKRPVTLKMNGKVRFETAADAVVTISGPVTFDGQGIAADCALFFFNGDLGEITLDGVTIQNYNNLGASSVNNYGSAIAATGSTVTLRDVTIKDCVSKSRGAAFYGYNDASLIAENCTFENLTGNASYGGAISIVNAKIVDLDSCEFTNCTASSFGGAIGVREGTDADLGTCDVAMTVDNCTFTNCTASTRGGAIGFGGVGSLAVNGGSFTNCMVGDAAQDIYVDESTVKLDGAQTISAIKLNAGCAVEPLAGFSVTEPIVIDGKAGTKVLVGDRVAELHDTAFKGTDETRTIDESGILNVSGAAVATVDGTPYTSLVKAVEEAKKLGTDIDVYLVGAESFNEETTIELGDNVRLFVDADAAATINGNGKLTIVGSDTATRHLCKFNKGGMLTLNGVTVKTHTTGSGNGAFDVEQGALVLNNCVIEDLTSPRGAVYVRNTGSSLVATDTVFKNNTSTVFGGAISVWSKCNIELYGCTFENNTAVGSTSSTKDDNHGCGGAIGISNVASGTLTIKSSEKNDTTFKNNTASTKFGGAIAIVHTTTDSNCAIATTIENATFTENTSKTYGGAIAWRRHSGSVMNITNCVFNGNESGTYGGAISAYNGNGGGVTLNIKDSEIKNSTAGTHSGAIYFYGKALNITDSSITGNTAGTAGDAAVRATNSTKTTLDGCTITGNSDYDIYNYNMTLTLKNKNNIGSIFLRTAVDSKTGEQLYRSVTPDASFTTDAPIALIPEYGVGHPAITGSYIEANLPNFFVAKTDGTADTTLTIGTDGVVAAVAAE